MITQNIREALSSLSRHRLRTGLSVLGVAIGIAAVICTAALAFGDYPAHRASMLDPIDAIRVET